MGFLYFYRNPLPLPKKKGFDKFISQTMFGIVFVLWLKNKSGGKTPGHCPQISFSVCGIKISKILNQFYQKYLISLSLSPLVAFELKKRAEGRILKETSE